MINNLLIGQWTVDKYRFFELKDIYSSNWIYRNYQTSLIRDGDVNPPAKLYLQVLISQ